MDMDLQGGTETRSTSKKGRRDVQWHAIDVHTRELTERDVADTHERQDPEEVLAELTVRGPRLTFTQTFERQRVDQHRLAPEELDVVGGRVAE
jgi:hypothetical protein